MADLITYMDHQWLSIEEDVVIIGVTEDGLDDITGISSVKLPPEGTRLAADEVCGEIDTDDGSLDIYCPIEGTVIEVNSAVLEDPSLVEDDPVGDGWLLIVEPKDPDDLKELQSAASDADDEDDFEEEEEDDDYDDDDDDYKDEED